MNNEKLKYTFEVSSINLTLLVGALFSGRAHLLLNKVKLLHLDKHEHEIKTIFRSPDLHEIFVLEAVSLEKVSGDFLDYQNCCVQSDDF